MIQIIRPGTRVQITHLDNSIMKARVNRVLIGLDNSLKYELSYWVDSHINYVELSPSEFQIEADDIKFQHIGFKGGPVVMSSTPTGEATWAQKLWEEAHPKIDPYGPPLVKQWQDKQLDMTREPYDHRVLGDLESFATHYNTVDKVDPFTAVKLDAHGFRLPFQEIWENSKGWYYRDNNGVLVFHAPKREQVTKIITDFKMTQASLGQDGVTIGGIIKGEEVGADYDWLQEDVAALKLNNSEGQKYLKEKYKHGWGYTKAIAMLKMGCYRGHLTCKMKLSFDENKVIDQFMKDNPYTDDRIKLTDYESIIACEGQPDEQERIGVEEPGDKEIEVEMKKEVITITEEWLTENMDDKDEDLTEEARNHVRTGDKNLRDYDYSDESHEFLKEEGPTKVKDETPAPMKRKRVKKKGYNKNKPSSLDKPEASEIPDYFDRSKFKRYDKISENGYQEQDMGQVSLDPNGFWIDASETVGVDDMRFIEFPVSKNICPECKSFLDLSQAPELITCLNPECGYMIDEHSHGA